MQRRLSTEERAVTRPLWSLVRVLLFCMAVGVLFRVARVVGGFTLPLTMLFFLGGMVFLLPRMHRQALEVRKNDSRVRGRISRVFDSFNDTIYPLLAWGIAVLVGLLAGMGGFRLTTDFYPQSQTLPIVAGGGIGLFILAALAIGAQLPGTEFVNTGDGSGDREDGRS